ncbi:Dimethyladenosine transferase [Gurleya vavrai]
MANPLFNKNLGQHILISQSTIQSIITKSKIKTTDTILEIGPGTGALTIPILQKCKKLICIEKDTRLASELLKKVQALNLSHKFELIIGDALKITFPNFDMCISNTPYQISSPLVFKLLKIKHRCSILMFQREFADRLVARVGSSDYCRLSVSVQINAKVEHLLNVSKKCFLPMPKVESSVVRIENTRDTGIDMGEFNNLLRMCFLRKNKTLSAIFNGEGILNQMQKYLEKAKINLNEPCSMEIDVENEDLKIKAKKENKQKNALNDIVIKRILNKGCYAASRANKMEIEDFLNLFLEFKREGINFI